MIKAKKTSKEKGIIISDAIIAILIILLFTGVLMSLIINIVLESGVIKLKSQQMDFATEILEYAEIVPYSQVNEENLIRYFNNKGLDKVSAGKETDNLSTPNKIYISVDEYNKTEGNEDKLDIIKTVTVKINTEFNKKVYSTEISSVKKASADDVIKLLEQ